MKQLSSINIRLIGIQFFQMEVFTSLTYRVRPITNKKSALSYLKLLKSIPNYINQQSTLIKKGIDAGISQPLIIFKGYRSTYEKHITLTAEENFYYTPFKNLPKQLSDYEKDSLIKAAKDVVLYDVIPAFKNVKDFLKTSITLILENQLEFQKLQMGRILSE